VAGEEHLLRTAELWAGPEIAARVRFTDVARKDIHVRRGRVADLFLDTVEVSSFSARNLTIWYEDVFLLCRIVFVEV
jgi:protein O-GlcNAc transferase